MQHRRNSESLAYALQPLSCHICGFREEQSGLGAGQGIAAGGDHKHIVLDQLFYQVDVAVIMDDLGVVAADYG